MRSIWAILGAVRRFVAVWAGAALLVGLTACKGPPRQFRVVSLGEAERHLRSGRYTLVEAAVDPNEAAGGGTGEIHWQLPSGKAAALPDLPPGPLLIVAATPGVGHRSAAAAARFRQAEILLFVPESAREMRTLYAPLAAKGVEP
jgi:hypothetical protein